MLNRYFLYYIVFYQTYVAYYYLLVDSWFACTMNYSNNTTLYYTSAFRAEYTAVPAIIFMTILISNVFVILTFGRMQKLKLQHIIMTGLAIADILTLIPYGLVIVTLASSPILLSDEMCKWFGVLATSLVGTTPWIHCGLCIEKCTSIVKPIAHREFSRKSHSRCIIACSMAVCIFVSFLFCFALMIFEVVKFEFVPNIPGGGFKIDRGVICLAAMFIGLPLLIQIITHLLIIVCVFKMNNRKYTGSVIKAMRTIALTLFLYDQCVVIFIVHLIWRLISSKAPPPWLQFISYHCLYTNSAMGFFIYFLTIQFESLTRFWPYSKTFCCSLQKVVGLATLIEYVFEWAVY